MKTNKHYFKRYWPVILVFVFLITAVITYAYWDNLEDTAGGDINIGKGVTLTVETDLIPVEPEKTLIPEGSIKGPNDVTKLTYEYKVKVDKTVSTPLDLTVTCFVTLKTGEATEAEQAIINKLVDAVIEQSADVVNKDYPVIVGVMIKLIEPDDQEEYDFIKNKELKFVLTFTAE